MAHQKVLLINPPVVVKASWKEEMEAFPLGLAYIAAVLKQRGFEVAVLDAFIEGWFRRRPLPGGLVRIGLDDKGLRRAVEQAAPDVVGISVSFSCQLNSALRVNSLIKNLDARIVTVAGGNHVTAVPGSIPPGTFDWLVMGEGEYRLPGLIEALNRGEVRPDIPGVQANGEEAPAAGSARPGTFIEDLDQLPFPAYDLLPLRTYWRTHRHRRWFNMIATRGCPYSCTFCSIHTVMGRKVRYRSNRNILDELHFLKTEFRAEQIYFEDDNISFHMDRAKELFADIARAGLGLEIFLRNGIRADRVDSELLELMKEAGVGKIWFSPECGSQDNLDRFVGKNMKLEDCEHAVRTAKSKGLDVACFLIIGFPDETPDDIRQTVRYGHRLRTLGSDEIWLSCATPYPGTALFDDCLKRGIIAGRNIDYQSLSTMDSVIHNAWFTAEDIKTLRDRAMRELNPGGARRKAERLRKAARKMLAHPRLFARVAGLKALKTARLKIGF